MKPVTPDKQPLADPQADERTRQQELEDIRRERERIKQYYLTARQEEFDRLDRIFASDRTD
jgi:hypothetical protein